MEAPLALYRRYRPETFSEVIGQDHVTVPLRNALSNNRVNHAYLFSGPRGCGKTTSARILARAINCEKGPIAEPCGVCKSCTDLARGGPGSIDVIEIDAASHGGVDDARDLRERAFFAPVESRYKIYIIDEAHMVTTQGFNALLKLVEEPPPHLKFIFATTEPDKVIGTIRSRTHHYPFRLVPPKALADYMATLCTAEGVTIEPAALPLVVRAGAGSVRDSLSVLDQLIGGADAEGVTYRLAVQLLGFTPDSLLDACVDGFAAHDSKAVFETIEKVIETGQDPKRFAEDLLRRLRDLVILSAVPNAVASGLIEAAEDQGERLQTQAAGIGPAELTRAADIVAAGLLEMRGATAPRLQLELICAKVLLPGADDSTNGIQARLDRMERRLTIGIPAGSVAAGTAGVGQAGTSGAPAQTAAGQSAAIPATPAHGQSAAPAAGSAGRPGSAGRADSASQEQPGSGSAAAAGSPNAAGSAASSASQHAGTAGSQGGADDQAGLADGGRSGAWPDESGTPQASGHSKAAASTVPAAPAQAGPPTAGSQAAPAQGAPAEAAPGDTVPAGVPATGSSSGSVGLADVRRLWPEILEAVKSKRRFAWIMLSQNAQVIAIDEQTLTLGLVNAGARESFARSGSDEILRQAMIDTIGLTRRVEAVVDPSTDPGGGTPAAPSSPPPGGAPSSSWDAPPPAGPQGNYPPTGSASTPPGASPTSYAPNEAPSATTPGSTPSAAHSPADASSAGTPTGSAASSAGLPGADVSTGGPSTAGQHAGPLGGGQSGDQPGGPFNDGLSAGAAPANSSGASPTGHSPGEVPAASAPPGTAPFAGSSADGGSAAADPSHSAGGSFADHAATGVPAADGSVSKTTVDGTAQPGGAPAHASAGVQDPQPANSQLTGEAGAVRAPLQADQQAGEPAAPAASPDVPDRREQAASKRRAAEAAVAAEQGRRATTAVQEAPLTPEEEAMAIGEDDVVLEEDSRSHTDLLRDTLGAQIILEETN